MTQLAAGKRHAPTLQQLTRKPLCWLQAAQAFSKPHYNPAHLITAAFDQSSLMKRVANAYAVVRYGMCHIMAL